MAAGSQFPERSTSSAFSCSASFHESWYLEWSQRCREHSCGTVWVLAIPLKLIGDNVYLNGRTVNQRLMLPNKLIVAVSCSPTSRAPSLRNSLCLARNTLAALALAISLWASTAVAQSSTEDAAPPTVSQKEASLSGQDLSPQASDTNAQPKARSANTTVISSPHQSDDEGKQ